MTSRVAIESIAALDEFRAQLSAHQAEITVAMDAAARQALHTLGQIGQRMIYWQRQKDAWEAEARRRLADLQRCEAMQEDVPRDCSSYYDVWAQAARAAAQAAGNLQEAEVQFNRVKEAAEQFQTEKQRLSAELEATVSDAVAALVRVASRARAVHAGMSAGVVFNGGGSFPLAGRAPPLARGSLAVESRGSAGPIEGQGIEGEPAMEHPEGTMRLAIRDIDGKPAAPRGDFEREGPGSPERGW